MRDEMLVCPTCGLGLESIEQALKCEKGHSFDQSAKGYTNLLLSQDKHSREPGDSKEMVKARKRFLEQGFYEPLAKGLAQTIIPLWSNIRSSSPAILDAGCGEGYYTHYIFDALQTSGFPTRIIGMDISKDAIKAAAKRPGPDFYVASLFKLPVREHSMDMVINAFAPVCDSEFRRVLKKDGFLVAVIPGKKHLFTLKSIIYDSPYENDEEEPELPSFRLLDKMRIEDEITLIGQDTVFDLLAMTPYYWRTPEEGVNRLKKVDSLKTAIEFIILVYVLK